VTARGHRPDMQRRRTLNCGLALALLALGAGAAAETGVRAWTHTGVSPGLHTLERSVAVPYPPDAGVPHNAVITRVHAGRDHAGNADIQSFLCWNGVDQCVEIQGPSVNTAAFRGLPANQPLYLVHRLRAWRGAAKPVFVRGTVTVWYAQTESAHTQP